MKSRVFILIHIICIYVVCTYMCVYIYIYTQIVCVCVCVYTYAYIHISINVFIALAPKSLETVTNSGIIRIFSTKYAGCSLEISLTIKILCLEKYLMADLGHHTYQLSLEHFVIPVGYEAIKDY